MTTAERQDQASRIQAVNNQAFSLFMQECVRSGVPHSDEECQKLIDRCFSSASIVQDYLRSQAEPFI